ncbi:MAG: hypothetical protein OEZ22_07935 [Spirochaetia bacterium]|nr:hypothetical protein [Spirochaetia bacterium]
MKYLNKRNIKKFLSIGILFLVSVIFGGCGASMKGVRVDKSFTYQSVVSSQMVVGGVTSVISDIQLDESNMLSNLLKTYFLERRENYKLMPTGVVSNKLGEKPYKDLLEEYKNNGALSEKSINVLREKTNGVKYIAFVRIESDDITKSRNEIKVKKSADQMESKVTRSVSVSMTIYDINSNIIAWSGTGSTSKTNTSKYDIETDNALVALVKVAAGTKEKSIDEKYPFPQEPNLKDVLERIFDTFADNMPEE